MPTGERNQPTRRLLLTVLLLCGMGAYLSGEAVSRQADLWSNPTVSHNANANANANTDANANTNVTANAGVHRGVLGRICHATQAWGLNCAATSRSAWSQFTIPIPVPSGEGLVALHRVRVPVSFVGLAYFVFLGSWFLFVARSDVRIAPRWPLHITRGGVLFSAGCLGLMAVRVVPACAICIAVHGLNIVLVWAVSRVYRQSALPTAFSSALPLELPHASSGVERFGTERSDVDGGQWLGRGRIAKRQAMCAACFAVVLIAGLWLHRREQLALGQRVLAYKPFRAMVVELRADPDFLRWEYQRQPRLIEEADDEKERFGDASESQLTVFTDFQCPNCVCADKRIQRLATPSFDGHLRVNVRHFPLDSDCNDTVTHTRHTQACEAAYAAEAARMQGGEDAFDQMKALLFESRKKLRPSLYAKLAQQAGLNVEQFQRDMDGDPVRAIVQRDIALAKRLGVSGTPTVFLNGRKVTEFGLDNPLYWRTMADDWFSEHEATRIGAAIGAGR